MITDHVLVLFILAASLISLAFFFSAAVGFAAFVALVAVFFVANLKSILSNAYIFKFHVINQSEIGCPIIISTIDMIITATPKIPV